jgi:glutathione peroxidase
MPSHRPQPRPSACEAAVRSPGDLIIRSSNQAPTVPGRRFRAGSRACLLTLLCSTAIFAPPAFSLPHKPDTLTQTKAKPGVTDAAKSGKPDKPEKTAYDYNLPGADGKDVPLNRFKGKYILIVNLARNSSYNEQLPALIKLADTYKDKNLVVLGVPSNDFGASEPGTEAEIQKAYADAKVNFPIMAVSKLSGDDEIPFYLYLTKSKGAPAGGPVHWNYTKFFVDKNGKVIARLDPDVAPDSHQMLSTVDEIVSGTFKPKKTGDKAAAPSAPDDDDDD